MKKKLFKITTITLLLLILLTGCGNTVSVHHSNGVDRPDKYSMFTVVEQTSHWQIVYHRETKVMYAVSDSGYNYGTFTLLVDEEGKPLLYGDGIN
jgi:hypothetical protein